MKKYVVAVIGATGNVGREVLNYLYSRNFPVKTLIALASERSVGAQVSFGDDTLKVDQMKGFDFAAVDIAFFCAGSEVSRKYAKEAANKGCIVIDKSSLFRLDKDVPLIVPEANLKVLQNFKSGIAPQQVLNQTPEFKGEAAERTKVREHDRDLKNSSVSFKTGGGIISNPNCCTIPLSVVLKPLDNAVKIKRVVISTYQSVSGAGKEAMDELYNQTKAKFIFESLKPSVFPKQIAFNLFPHIGEFRKDGSTEEEYKIQEELKKIIGNHINPTVTCVRVPVFVSHSMSVNVEFEDKMSASFAEELLYEADGVVVYSRENEMQYTTPIDAVEHDDVFVSRIRNDPSKDNCINMWICTDNLRKGAALNAVQIAEELVKN